MRAGFFQSGSLSGDDIMMRFALTKEHVVLCLLSCGFGVMIAHGSKCAGSTEKAQEDATANQKPVLRRATPEALGLDHWPGSSLRLVVEGEHRDLHGLRIMEQFVDANGVIFTLKEDYPVWIDSSYAPSWGRDSVNVHFRQHKDEQLWQQYLEDVRVRQELAAKNKEAQAAGEAVFHIETKKMEIPPVWLSLPEPNKVRVFVSVYDRAGNESEAVEIKDVLDWFFSQEKIEEYSKDSGDDYYLGTESALGTHPAVSPSDIDNAALLYYQAFLNRPQPDAVTGLIMNRVLRGAEPDRNIRRYLKHCRQTIRLAETAARISQCNWGSSSAGRLGSVPLADLRQLSYVLSLYARALVADGHYRPAIDSSLVIRQLARHVGDENVLLYLAARQIDSMALRTMQHVLGVMSADADTLEWLRGQLAVVQGPPASLAQALQNSFTSAVQNVSTNPDLLEKITNSYVQTNMDDQLKEKTGGLKDEELLTRVWEPYVHFLNVIFKIIDSELPYELKYKEIQRLENRLQKENRSNPVARYATMFGGGLVARQYGFNIRDAAHSNALKAAVDIYLINARTGQLPDMLPEGLPRDPFSGRDFEYEVTEEGFVLRCKARDLEASPTKFRPDKPPEILSDKFQQYEFRVRK
jgi:hypothetical protein